MAEEAPQPFERVFGGFKAAVSSSFKLLRNVGRDKTDAADSVDTPEEPDEQAYSEALLEQPSDGFGGPKCPLLPDHDAMVVLQLGCTGHQDMEHRWRVVLWRHCIESFAFGAAPYSTYLQQALPVEVRSDIKKDCPRTYPSHQRFACPEGRRALRNVLTAYAAYDPDVGYCQGMNFLAGLLLMNLPTEALAFEGLVLLMKGRRLDGFFGRDMTELQVQLWQLGQLMPPRLARHLEAYGVMPVMFAASWLMTCFSSDFNTDFSARIMDVVLGGSCDAALLKVAVAVLQRAEAQLLGMHDLEALLLFLKVAVPAWDSDTLHQVLDQAFARPWTRRQLQVMAEGSASKAETVAQTVERVTAQCLRQAASASTPGSTAATPSAAGQRGPGPCAHGVRVRVMLGSGVKGQDWVCYLS
ncbi:rab-GTPase-TBC domain-containing protein [Haematococcus lacustris]